MCSSDLLDQPLSQAADKPEGNTQKRVVQPVKNDLRVKPKTFPFTGRPMANKSPPCFYDGVAAIVDTDSYHQGYRRMERIEQLRLHFAYVEPQGIDEYDPDIRFGIAGASVDQDGVLKFGGSERSLGFWSGLIGSTVLCRKCLRTPLSDCDRQSIVAAHPEFSSNPEKFSGYEKGIGICHGDGTKRVVSKLIAKGRNRGRCKICHANSLKVANDKGVRQPFWECIVGEGFLYSPDTMTDNSLHLSSGSPFAKFCDKLKYGLLASKKYDPIQLPSQVYVTPLLGITKPAWSEDSVVKLFNNWFDGRIVFNTSLSPVDGTVKTVHRRPVDNALVITIGNNQVIFPPEFEEVVDSEDVVSINDILAEPKRLTREEVVALSQPARSALVNVLADGICVETSPVIEVSDGVTVYDYTFNRKRGVIYYPYGLLRNDQVGATYVDCIDIPRDPVTGSALVQVWDLSLNRKDLAGKPKFNSSALMELGKDSLVRYDLYSSPRRTLVEEYKKSQMLAREEFFRKAKEEHEKAKKLSMSSPLDKATPSGDTTSAAELTAKQEQSTPIEDSQSPIERSAGSVDNQ